MAHPILVVDDEQAIRTIAARLLSELGYVVATARHGGEALRLLTERDGGARLVLTDLVMPVVSGVELVRTVRERWPNVPVLCMSGYADELAAAETHFGEACPMLKKPFSASELESRVRALAGDP